MITDPATNDDDQALLERLAKREERRQRRMREALERQKEFDPTITDGEATVTTTSEDRPSRRSHLRDAEKETTKNEIPSSETNSWTETKEKESDQNVEESIVEVEETAPVKAEPAPETASEEPKDKQDDPVEKKEKEEEAERPIKFSHGEEVII